MTGTWTGTFFDYIRDHTQPSDDSAGDFRQDAIEDKKFPVTANSWEEVALYLTNRHPDIIAAAKEIWENYVTHVERLTGARLR